MIPSVMPCDWRVTAGGDADPAIAARSAARRSGRGGARPPPPPPRKSAVRIRRCCNARSWSTAAATSSARVPRSVARTARTARRGGRHLAGQGAAADRRSPPGTNRSASPDPQGLLAVDAAARGQQLERGLRADDPGQRHRDAEAGVEAQQRGEVAGEAGLGRHHPEVRSRASPRPRRWRRPARRPPRAAAGGTGARPPRTAGPTRRPSPAPPKSAPAQKCRPSLHSTTAWVSPSAARSSRASASRPIRSASKWLFGGRRISTVATWSGPARPPRLRRRRRARSSAGTYQRAGGSPKSGVAGQVAEHRGPLGGRFPGRPRAFSPRMLRWISPVPPAIDWAGTDTITRRSARPAGCRGR